VNEGGWGGRRVRDSLREDVVQVDVEMFFVYVLRVVEIQTHLTPPASLHLERLVLGR
jgi:hypothetical protein